MAVQNEFQLFKERRFFPLFASQFLGALNDNLFKNALIIFLAFGKPILGFNQDTLINICAALFILPYFLFSAIAGQLADKYEKSNLIRWIKFAEVLLAIIISLGFYFNHFVLLLLGLFLLGTQATFFGPLKYSILPQQLKDSELVGGNGLVEMGTFIAILIGTIVGGVLIAIPNTGNLWVSLAILLVAFFGFAISLAIPKAPPYMTSLTVDWNLFKQTISIVKDAFKIPTVFYSIIGISWFWLYGSIFLTQTPNYTKLILGGNEYVATLILVAFSIGIGLGSAMCEWLSSKKIELGFVSLGSLGLTLFSIDLALTTSPFVGEAVGALTFLSEPQSWRILIDGTMMGASGGIYLVPLYTLIQKTSPPEKRSRMIAANNIVNAVFMVGASLMAIVVLNAHFSIPELFMITAFLNLGMGGLLFKLNKYPAY